MKLKNISFFCMALLAASSLFAAKSSSSSDDSCCEKTKKLAKQINQTTQQDLVVDQMTLSVVNQINSTTRQDLAVDQEILDIVNHLIDCSCTCIVINPEDFMDEDGNLTVTYVITEPGNYCLGADVAFAPADEFTPAIVILADNVRLDLRGYTLSQANDTPNAYGVQIGEGYNYNDPNDVLDNITVLNGTIRDFTAIGVFCYNASFDDETFDQAAFQDLAFADLNILQCGSSPSFDFASGIDLDSSAGLDPTIADLAVAYRNVIVENCNVNNCLGNSALQFYTVDNLVLRNTQANELTSEVDVFGTFAHNYYGRNIQMFDCQGNGTRDFHPVPSFMQVGGINLSTSANIYLSNCQFNDTYGEGNYIVQAANFSENYNAVFENCQFNNTVGGPSVAFFVAGVHASSGEDTVQANGMKFINCQFNGTRNNTTLASSIFVGLIQCCGFQTRVDRNLTFENCQACNIQSDSPLVTTVSGFEIINFNFDHEPETGDVRNVAFSNCVSSDIVGLHDAVGYDFRATNATYTGEQSVMTNIVLQDCIAERIQGGADTAVVAGISGALLDTSSIADSGLFSQNNDYLVKGCRISDVRSTGGDVSSLSAGILLQSVTRPVLLQNSISDCDRGVLLTGIEENPPGFSNLGVIQENEVDNCSISCYQDDSDPTTSAWINNTAFNCGDEPSEFTNYDINFAGVRPVDAGTLSNYPVGGNKYYNLSLVP